jgi:glucokinase
MSGTALLADIGGTNARFALVSDGVIRSETHLEVSRYAEPAEALRDFLDRVRPDPMPTVAAFAVAGPVEGDRVELTNSEWTVSAEELHERFDFDRVVLINDFAAIAWAVPRLSNEDLVKIGGGEGDPRAPAAILGPGTGLGVAGLIPGKGGATVLVTEGGHATMSPADERDGEIIDRLRRRFGHVSAERVLSGEGMVNLYETISEIKGRPAIASTAAAITEHALSGGCPASVAALEVFCGMLGTVAGNLALTLGARGGVYIAGGIVPRFADFLANSSFRDRFEAKGRFSGYLAGTPTWVVVHPDPAFLGLVRLLERMDGAE